MAHRKPLSTEHKERIGAARIGITLAEYHAKREAGLKWCFAHQDWKPRDTKHFHRRRGAVDDGLNDECRACVNPRAREGMRRLSARRRAEAHAS